MKKETKVSYENLAYICVSVIITTLLLVFLMQKPFVKVGMYKVYQEYLSERDSVKITSKPIAERLTLKELREDSAGLSAERPDLKLFIIPPQPSGDSIIKGQLKAIYYRMQKREKIPYFELLKD